MSYVQSSGTNFGSVTSTSRSFAAPPTAGHLLTAELSMSIAPVGLVDPAGWTRYADCLAGAVRVYRYWKLATGSEGSVAWSWTSGGGFGSVTIKEWNDAVAGPPIVAEDESNVSAVVTSQASGTATATVAGALAIALFAADTFAATDGGRAYSNGFTEVSADGSSTRSSLFVATKTIAGTGDVSTTFSCVDTGDEMYGSVALFQPAGVDEPVLLSAAGASVGLVAGAGAIAPGSAVVLSAAGAQVPLQAGAASISVGTAVLLSAAGASVGLVAGAAGISIGSSVLLSAAGAAITLLAGSVAIAIGSGVPVNAGLFARAARRAGAVMRRALVGPARRIPRIGGSRRLGG